jgi:ADP-ribosylglycohydrolase
MFIAAMIACAAVTTNIEDIILGGLAEIPHTSRLHEQVTELLADYHNGTTQNECFTKIHTRYNEHNGHDWCHTISNALIVVASLLYGNGDYGKSICMSVEAGFDTDCNGATVGSILGMAFGLDCIEDVWSSPIQNRLHTSIFGVGTVNITDMVQKTMNHIILE